LGSIGRRHLNNLRALGCSKFVFYRTFQSTLSDVDAGAGSTTASLDEALSQRPTIAIVSNPSAKHIEVALAAAKAGCHLFIEKPLADSLEHCPQLALVAREKRLTTMIGCQFRFHPLLGSLRNSLHSGRIGEPLGARAEWGEYLPDWHPWEDHRKSYSARADLGGGVVLTLIHALDYLYWLFGEVRDVQAVTRSIPSLQTAAADDWAEILLRFAGGPIAQVHLDYVQKPSVHRLCVWGDRGRAVLDFQAGELCWEATDGTIDIERVPAGFERNTMFLDEMREFLDAVANGRPSSIPLEQGIDVLDIALQVKHAAAGEVCRA
jgi:predicted dehydrogenase